MTKREVPEMTAKRLKELLSYDKDTGLFINVVTRSPSAKAGSVAGCPNSDGYLVIGIGGRNYKCHRLAWLYVNGEWPDHEIDHKNTIRTDNRWDNLRRATHAQNVQNIRKARKDNKIGLLGVSPNRNSKRWRAQITVCGVKKYLGTFDTPDVAHAVYLSAKEKFHTHQTLVGECSE